MELKLTQVARASLEELRLDYEDFLRQRRLNIWERDNPLRQELINRRCKTADEVAAWIANVKKRYRQHGQSGGNTNLSMLSILDHNIYPEISANAVLVLIVVACSLLDRQVSRLAQDFENDGGFTERLYKIRSAKRKGNSQ
jgi:four helix bundle suffix protein